MRIALFALALLVASSAPGHAAPGPRGASRSPQLDVTELSRLFHDLRDTTFIVRMRAVTGLGGLKGCGDTCATALARVALRDRNADIRMTASWQLSYFPDSGPAMLAVIAPAVTSRDSTVRARAAQPLAHLAEVTASAMPLLLTLLRDPAPSVRASVGDNLQWVLRTWPEQVPALVEAFATCGPDLRFAVGDALIPAGVAAAPPMLDDLASADWNVRANAARVLGEIGETDGRVAAALVPLLDDADFRVRGYTLRALEALGGPAAHDALVRRRGGADAYGPPHNVLELHSFAERPDSSILVVAGTWRRVREPLTKPQYAAPLPDVVLAEEHRLYWCDFRRGTVRLLARVDVPDDMRSGFGVIVDGWRGGRLAVETYGRAAHHRYSPEYSAQFRSWAVDPTGRFTPLAARPGSADYVPGYRDLPSGHREFWRFNLEHDQVMESVDDGPRKPIFHADPESGDLLPGPP